MACDENMIAMWLLMRNPLHRVWSITEEEGGIPYHQTLSPDDIDVFEYDSFFTAFLGTSECIDKQLIAKAKERLLGYINGGGPVKIHVDKLRIVYLMLDAYLNNSVLACKKFRRNMNITDFDVAELFTISKFYNEGYFTTKKEHGLTTSRFFSILSRLPVELQMMVCNKVYDKHNIFINQKEIDFEMKVLLEEIKST